MNYTIPVFVDVHPFFFTMNNPLPNIYNKTVQGLGKVKQTIVNIKNSVVTFFNRSNGTEGPDLKNTSIPPDEWDLSKGQVGIDLTTNFDPYIATDSSSIENNDSSQLYWLVGLVVVISSAVAVLLIWLLLTWRRRSGHNMASHDFSSPSDFKSRPSTVPRLQLTPDVIPQRRQQTEISVGPTSSSQPECIELKPYLLPYLKAGKERAPEESRDNPTQGSDSDNRNARGIADESSNPREQRSCIQFRPPAPNPQPDSLTDTSSSAFRENSLYANIPNENIYAIPRTRTPSEVVLSSNREFVHVYELPPDFVNNELDPATSTQCLFKNSP